METTIVPTIQLGILTTELAKTEIIMSSSLCNSSIQDVPGPPVNITILGIFTTTVLLQWHMDCDKNTATFELHVSPLTSDWMNDAELVPFVVTRISWTTRQYKVKNLIPQTVYTIYITAKNEYGTSNNSELVTFKTKPAIVAEYGGIRVRPIEVILVFGILSAWFLTIAWFLRKWGTIRISQPGGERRSHQPKNLDTIKIVDTATDSVIYRNYGQDIHRTMQARQKRLDRMHTMPNIKLPNIPSPHMSSPKHMYVPKQVIKDKYPGPGVTSVPPVNVVGMKASKNKNTSTMEIFPEETSEQSEKSDSEDIVQSTSV